MDIPTSRIRVGDACMLGGAPYVGVDMTCQYPKLDSCTKCPIYKHTYG